ncbi:sensor histidine kinase [Nanchangia anserum]|uniref:histidine kinase n=1 Tax=Nanchangia anserum TaxID=2692125 RepID=A0A8I0KQZ3_9ACTO|nr:histidine kinase [Nanchangia anserum]MBD3688927.1 sensor histidine kinase [Nanchangia anserum]QOX81194.1 sensor histidine kinase [Nanchangia anserum]
MWPFSSRRRARDRRDDVAALTRSRRIIVEAYEVERRRIERDLHDGTQQSLVAASFGLGEALEMEEVRSHPVLFEILSQAQVNLERSLKSLRHTVHGIHPQVLTDLGLVAALDDLVGGDPNVSVRCPQPLPDLPEGVLATAYFFVSEALTNARKYAPGAPVSILVTAGVNLRLSIVDSGPGGATIRHGGGLEGMTERAAAIGGTLSVSSPIGGPTRVALSIPLLLFEGEPSIVIDPLT